MGWSTQGFSGHAPTAPVIPGRGAVSISNLPLITLIGHERVNGLV